jgi:SAM-dependent methyltransferase
MLDVVENIHGNRKRLLYTEELLRRFSPRSVLDVGCGNGTYLTAPLAERYTGADFIGIDSDERTIAVARSLYQMPNLHFYTDEEFKHLAFERQFDWIIASEVIEHVEQPGEFLRFLHSKLAPGGHVLITTPNGYGAFELMTAIETVLDLMGVMKILSRLPLLRSLKVGTGYDNNAIAQMQSDTLAISPHVNFFSFGRLLRLFAEAGFRVIEYRPRSLFGGLGFQQLLRSPSALHWNAYCSDTLPPHLVSGWMFVLEPTGAVPAETFSYKRRLNERLRRWWTAKRWGTA